MSLTVNGLFGDGQFHYKGDSEQLQNLQDKLREMKGEAPLERGESISNIVNLHTGKDLMEDPFFSTKRKYAIREFIQKSGGHITERRIVHPLPRKNISAEDLEKAYNLMRTLLRVLDQEPIK